ncbi:MAG: aminodeoxychorismate/anthranilate synthase component II [Gemmatimonadaceae bacterium]
MTSGRCGRVHRDLARTLHAAREAGCRCRSSHWGPEIPILGVCLGHQAIGEAYGGRVVRAGRVMHGKTSRIRHDEVELFDGLPNPLRVMRYHSLIVERHSLPACLRVTAETEDAPDEIHAMRHVDHPVWGVQFHPESVLTEGGLEIIRNFLRLARRPVVRSA